MPKADKKPAPKFVLADVVKAVESLQPESVSCEVDARWGGGKVHVDYIGSKDPGCRVQRIRTEYGKETHALLEVSFDNRHSGLFTTFSTHGSHVTVAFSGWEQQKAVAAILALLLAETEPGHDRFAATLRDRNGREMDEYRRESSLREYKRDRIQKDRQAIQRLLGPHYEPPDWMKGFLKRVQKSVNSYAGEDLEESKARVIKEFKFLRRHLAEDDILCMWRELIVEEVLTT